MVQYLQYRKVSLIGCRSLRENLYVLSSGLHNACCNHVCNRRVQKSFTFSSKPCSILVFCYYVSLCKTLPRGLVWACLSEQTLTFKSLVFVWLAGLCYMTMYLIMCWHMNGVFVSAYQRHKPQFYGLFLDLAAYISLVYHHKLI